MLRWAREDFISGARSLNRFAHAGAIDHERLA